MLGFGMILTGLILLFSSQTMQAAQQAAHVFVQSVMPALFPMMIAGGIMTSGLPPIHSRTGLCFFQIMFGFCAGSPASTRQLNALSEHPLLSTFTCRMLLCASGVMSPMFFIGTLASWVGPSIAWGMLVCHWVSALLTGVLYACIHVATQRLGLPFRRKKQHFICNTPIQSAQGSTRALPFSAVLPAAVSNAALAQLSILGAMIFFSILAALFKSILMQLTPEWTAAHNVWLAVGWSLMEIGGGAVSLLECQPTVPPWLLCALCSFSGLSIWLQNLLFLPPKINPTELLGFRMLHGVLAGGICYVVSPWLFNGKAAAEVIAVITVPVTPAVSGSLFWLPLLLVIALAAHPLLHRPSA